MTYYIVVQYVMYLHPKCFSEKVFFLELDLKSKDFLFLLGMLEFS